MCCMNTVPPPAVVVLPVCAAPSPRNAMLDIAKGLGIFLVVLGHSALLTREPNEAWRVIFSFHMPLFFFLAGMLLKPEVAAAPFTTARLHALLKPYLVVMLSLVAITSLFALLRHQPLAEPLPQQLRDVLLGQGESISRVDRTWLPLWYLPHASLVMLVCWVVLRAFGESLVARWLPLPFLVIGANIGYGAPWVWSADLLLLTTAFTLAGYSARRHMLNPSLYKPWALGLALATFVGMHAGWDEFIDLNERHYGNFAISSAQIASGIYLTLGAADWLAKFAPAWLRRALAYLGSGTLFILLFHPFFLGKGWGFATKFLHLAPIPAEVVSVALACAAPLLLWETAKRSRVLTAALLPLQRAPHAPTQPGLPKPPPPGV